MESTTKSNPCQHAEHAPPLQNTARPQPQKTTLYMIVFASWVAFFGWVANFDAAFGGIVLVMEPYKKSFGKCVTGPGVEGTPTETCSLTATQQSLIQLTSLFMAVGGSLAGVVGNYLGRRGTCQIGSVLIATGAAGMMGSAGSFLNYMVCKCIGGIGIGMLYSAAPTWGLESVSAQKRGFLMSLYNVGLACGNVGAAAVCVRSSKLTTDWAWRTPIACQIPVSIFLAVGSIFFPESPRWLLVNGNQDKARRSFARFYNKDANSETITWQVEEVNQHIEFERNAGATTSWTEIFHGLDLKRTHIALLVLLGNALTGVQFVIPYAALFLAGIGLTNPYLLNVAISACVLAGTIPGPFLCEYVGRRLSLLGGYTVMGISMLLVAALGSGLGQSSNTSHVTLVIFLCLWAFTFGATSGPIAWVSSVEMHSVRLRTFGQAYAVGLYEIFSFGAAFWTPYMLNASYGNMKTNVGYFYFGITVVVLVLTFAFVPETGRLSLEQIDEYFLDGRPAWKTSLKVNKNIVANDNEVGIDDTIKEF